MSAIRISEDVLRGILSALRDHAPHLLQIINDLLRSGEAHQASFGIGKSTSGQFYGSVSWEAGEAVLGALQRIEQEYGSRAVFEGRQINYIIMRWQAFIQPKQLPPE
jgi:hypothetical protein